MADHNEAVFESEICAYLEAQGWLYSADDTGYDRERALFPEDLFGWLEETQPSAYAKALKAAGSEAKFLDVLTAALDKPLEHGGGTLNILRNGVVYIGGGRLKMAQFRPDTSLNATTVEQYTAMRVRVMRQVHFSTADHRSIDLVFFVNGLPVATAELKTDFTQSLEEAISQYRKDRHPVTNGRPEPLLSFGHRALVHFAVSNDLAAMTTRLEGDKTYFLPFNIGCDHGAGNPPGEDGRSATAYLWERVWEKDAWLNIIGRLMIVETKEEWDVSTGTAVRRTSMLFPRFHQWEAVTKIVAAVAEEGVGHRYLIEHSAGSGKTNTIAWTAHRLARLHVNDEKVFDSVIVVVDRTVLDGQLQEAIRQLDGSAKILATISPEDVRKAGAKSKSGLLATALKNGELIIAVTVQTFPFALDEIRADSSLKGRKFAVIADEAHSSQSGQISSKLKAVLTAEEVKEIEDGGTVDVEAVLAAEMTERAGSENISYLAFTATPKNKTLELFGRKGPDGKPAEFHLYSMRQAIEEGYILDVLKGYQAYETALKIAGKIDESDEVEEGAARKGLMRWVKLHPTNISQKVQIIVEHFHTNVAYLLEGKAKAMVVTDSRKAAVKYKKAIDAYIAKRAAEDASYNYRTLVAFSSSVSMAENEEWAAGWGPQPGKDDEFTEANLNPGAGSDLAAAFKGGTYKIMLVANKFQTGFDQPLLSAMYVDKKLSGVTAVQTLSRLNRTHRTAGGEQKRKTFVIDFVNRPDDIRAAFEPYFTNATLETETDPYVVVHLAAKLAQAGIYTEDQVRDVARLWVERKGNNALSAAISPAKHDFARRYAAALEADDKVTLNTLDLFRKDVSTYVRLYDFMSQIVDYGDPYMEMLSIFLRLLEKVIADSSWSAEVDLSDVVLVGVKHTKTIPVDISLTGDGELKGISAAGTGARKEPKYVALQVVIDKMNDLFGAESFARSQIEEFVNGLVQRLLAYPDLVRLTRVNTKKQFMDLDEFQSMVTEAVIDNQDAHNTMADYFFSDGPGINAVIVSLADAFYEAAVEQRTERTGNADAESEAARARAEADRALSSSDPNLNLLHERRFIDPAISIAEPRTTAGDGPGAGGGRGGGGEPGRGGESRYLLGRFPGAVAPERVFSVLVSVVLRNAPPEGTSAPLKPVYVPPGGKEFVLLADASPGLRVLSDHRQAIRVPARGDSEPVKFDLVADAPGPQRVSVTAWDGGSFLGELSLELTVERNPPSRPDRMAAAPARSTGTAGEVTLLVRRDQRQNAYRFEFIDVDYPNEVTSELVYDPKSAVEQLVRRLNSLAEGASQYSAEATRAYLVNEGIQLWQQLLPEQLRAQFWERQQRVTQLRIVTNHDSVPWELLYPKDRGHDAGFLVEQFPVTRGIYGQVARQRLQLRPARFVVPPGSPPDAETEARVLARLLETGLTTVSELMPLLALIHSGDFGLLHFACHNRFDPEDGSSIQLDAPFTPTFLASAASDQTLARNGPLVFINACRSLGESPSYNRLDGWADKFLQAGAAAFIGSMWAVSDGAAREFAQELYRSLLDGTPLGQAVTAARHAIAGDSGDPTWLAYAVYGDPQATLTATAS